MDSSSVDAATLVTIRKETHELAEQVSKKVQVQLHEELQRFLKQLPATLSSHPRGAHTTSKAASPRSMPCTSSHIFQAKQAPIANPSNVWEDQESSLLSHHMRGYLAQREISNVVGEDQTGIAPRKEHRNKDRKVADASDQACNKPDTGAISKNVASRVIFELPQERSSVPSAENRESHLSETQMNALMDHDSKVYYHRSRTRLSKQSTIVMQGTLSVPSATRRIVEKVLCDFWFDALMGIAILANAILIGVQVDWNVKHRGEEAPLAFRVCDLVFCTIFVIEICLRLYVYRAKLYCMRGWAWNLFDTLLVLAQVLEEVVMVLGESNMGNLSFMRLMRIFRLIRIVRLVRIVRLIGELRLMVLSIMHSMKSLAWTLVIIMLLMYINAIWLTQLVADQTHKAGDAKIFYYYGSLIASIVSLFQSITGGIDWDDAMRPLTDEVDPVWGVVYCIYISFSVFAMLNVVTGVFVESALQSANNDKDITTVFTMGDFFKKVSGSKGKMSWPDFQSHLDSQQMRDYFKMIDIDISEARVIFRLLDLDQSGLISVDDFLSGCVRLRGPAKAIDLAMLMHTVRRIEMMLRTAKPERRSRGLESFQLSSDIFSAGRSGSTKVQLEPLRATATSNTEEEQDEVQSVEEL